MNLLAATALIWATVQDPVGEVFDRSQKELRMSLVELGPAAIPELEKRLEGPHREIIKQSIDEIRRLKEPIEKLIAQLSAEEEPTRDLAALELLKIGRPARSYLDAVPTNKSGRARAEWVLQRAPFKVWKPLSALQRELEWIRDRERVEIQTLRVRAMEEGVATGKITTLELTRARRDLAKARYKGGEITLKSYLETAQGHTAQEQKIVEHAFGTGTASTLEVLKVRLQGFYLDRRLGKEVNEEIKKLTLEASRHVRMQQQQSFGPEYHRLDQLYQLTQDRDEDLD